MPTFGSLFAGIGGIDLGLERAGWTGRWQVEWDPFCQRVLEKHWPGLTRYGDITTVDWSGVERVDLLAGGFPCQPASAAGRQKAQTDERWLWPEFLRAIRSLRPGLVLVENVTGLLAVNGGSAFGDVLGNLAASGYDAQWDCIPAEVVGAFHERDRLFIVAHSRRIGVRPDGGYGQVGRAFSATQGEAQERKWGGTASGGSGPVAHAAGERQPEPGQPLEWRDPQAHGSWQAVDAFSGRIGGVWEPEPSVGRVVDGFPEQMDRLRSLGNAVVPQVVEWIGRRLLEAYEADLTA